ncbi:MAG: T9SS type A sorting domain-containing protein [Bacteroidia bacterium]|nr:T9SS type A sorting domain-containing protein [Bacteroidia bacterium]
MKKSLLLSLVIGLMAWGTLQAQKSLYVDSMYPRSSVTRTQKITYQKNISVLTGAPKLDSFQFDLYTPTLNTSSSRPLVIFLHTGSFLPRYINQTTTGARDDSASVEFCTQMAQRGYVVAAVSYRLGWNPALGTEDARKSSIINAAYKSVQDVAAAVRFFKSSVKNNSNMYGIDSTKIAIGGQGTGAYAMYAYSALQAQDDIKIAKFYDFTLNKAMVNDSLWGDRFGYTIPGYPGTLAQENHKGYTSNAALGFAIGGCMGDSSWLKASQMPLISTHSVKDPFGPYKTDIVYVPGTNNPVVEVSGGYTVMQIENRVGNNNCYATVSKNFQDAYSVKSRTMNEGIEGLYPFHGVANGSGPWEWWDDSTILNAKLLAGGLTQGQITTLINNGKKSNPLMSKARALKYIDTVLGYTMPRVALCLGLWNGASYLSTDAIDLTGYVTVSPNPATTSVNISHNVAGNALTAVTLTDLNGREISTYSTSGNNFNMPLNVKPGIYLIQMGFEQGRAVKKIVVQ